MAVCVIPARGGSKRIPRKNIRDFHGAPMIGWSIAAAQDSGLFERIVVSTDDAEVSKIALGLGAEVPFFCGFCGLGLAMQWPSHDLTIRSSVRCG